LNDVIQMECLARNSSILEIYNEHVIGRIYIQDGQLVHALGGDLKGEGALYKLLSLPGGSFELAPFEHPEEKTLGGSWEMLLMEAARLRDENAANPPAGEAAVDPRTLSAPVSHTSSHLEETLVCTRSGDTLFDATRDDAPVRVNWMQAIEQQAAQLGQILPLGSFDRFESELAEGRNLVVSRGGKLVFVRVTTSIGNK
jgi:hypothetical protein